jgi:aspartate/methionine/tyrosine aminotransferase
MTNAPYMTWAKHRAPAAFDLAASNLIGCSIDDLEGAREALSLEGANPDGYPPLAAAIAARYGVAPSRVVVAGGCSGANLLAIGASAGRGDEVLMESPFYDPIAGTCRLVGAGVRFFDRRGDDYQLDLDALRRALTPRTRLVILTNPHNPSGVVLDDDAIRAAAGAAASVGATLLVDEVYLDIVNILQGERRHTIAAELAPNAISTSSLTKSYGLNALRCGWGIASDDTAERMRRVRDVVDGIGPVPIERLSVLAFEQMDKLTARARGIVEMNLDVYKVWAAGVKSLTLPAPVTSTVVFPRVNGVEDTRALCEALLREADVAVVPGYFFGAPGSIRISLAGRPDVLREGLARLARFLG